jgi:general secretion pathway protein J
VIRRERRRHAGFTLIELLIALTLLGLIVVLLFGGLRLGNQSWGGSDAKAERTAELRLVWRFLHERLAQARPVYLQDGQGGRLLFSGGSQGFEFVTPMPGHLGIGGYYLVRIQASGRGEKRELILNRWLYHPEILEGGPGIPEWEPLDEGAGDAGEGQPEQAAYYTRSVLVDRLQGIELAYLGSEAPGEEAEWHDEWMEKATLPLAVRVRLGDAKGPWPEMILGLPE